MATVGNLFVNIGASTKGLEQGLKKAQKDVKAFGDSTKSSLQGLAGSLPGVGEWLGKFEKAGKFVDNLKGSIDLFRGGVEAAAKKQQELTAAIEASRAADQALASAKGARKNIGMAREMLAKQGIDPNKAVAALKIEDTSAVRKSIAAAIVKQTEAEKALAGAQAFAAKAAKGKDPFTGQFLSAADKIKVAEKATKELAQAQANYTAAVSATTKAHGALAAVQKSNREKEATRGKLNAMGIDLSKGQGALKLPSLATFQDASKSAAEKVGALRKSIAEAAAETKIFGMPLSSAGGALTVVGAAAVAAVAGLLAFTKHQAHLMDALKDTAVAAGMNVEAYQQMNSTYAELGVAAGVAMTTSQRLGITIEEAAQGSEGAREKLDRLGIAYEDIGSLSPDKALALTISKIRELGSHRERMAALRDMFGKGGMGLAAAVNATNEEFKVASERAAKIVIPQKIVDDLAEVNDKVEAAGGAFGKLSAMLASTFAPVLSDLADTLFEMFTADPAALMGAFQSIAATCAVIYDVIAAIVNLLKAGVNVVMALGGVLGGAIIGSLFLIVETVRLAVRGFELLTGLSTELSDSMAEGSTVLKETSKNLFKGAGSDLIDVGSNLYDAIVPNATMGVVHGIQDGMQQSKAAIEGEPITLKATMSKSSLKEVEDDIQKLRDKVQLIQLGEAGVQMAKMSSAGASPQQMAEAQALQDKIGFLELQAAVAKQIADVEDDIAKATMTAYDYTVKRAIAEGATLENAKELAAMQDHLEGIKKQEETYKAIGSTIADLQTKVEELRTSEAQILQMKLEQLGAGQTEIDQALQLQQILEDAKIDDAMNAHFDKLNDRLLEAKGNEEEILRRQLQNMGLAGQALEDAVAATLGMQQAIADAEKSKTDAESVTATLQDLTDQLDKIKLGEAGVLEKKLKEAGASQDQIAQALQMQAEIAAADGKDAKAAAEKSAKGVIDSLDTAFGAFKTAGAVNTQSLQESLVRQGDKQVSLLSTIATGITSMTQSVTNGGAQVLMAGGANASTMASSAGQARQTEETSVLLKESNQYLKQIASNTAAFAGALT
jgi:hypothetical protein